MILLLLLLHGHWLLLVEQPIFDIEVSIKSSYPCIDVNNLILSIGHVLTKLQRYTLFPKIDAFLTLY
jgi:hypothetical protein